jgi:hypothetical protein
MQTAMRFRPLFIFLTLHVCRADEGFFFYRVLSCRSVSDELGEFSWDTLRVAFHNARPRGEVCR